MPITYAAELKAAKENLNKVFEKKIAYKIFKYSTAILETEKYVMFTKYVRPHVIEFLHAYLINIMVNEWFLYLDESRDTNADPLKFMQQHAYTFQRQLYNVALELTGKRIVFDYMEDEEIHQILKTYFQVFNYDKSLIKNIKSLIIFKGEYLFESGTIDNLINKLNLKAATVEFLFKTYLTIKETIYKELGYKVELDFQNMQDFEFKYLDPIFADQNEKAALEYNVIKQTLQIIDPENSSGDLILFLKKFRPDMYLG